MCECQFRYFVPVRRVPPLPLMSMPLPRNEEQTYSISRPTAVTRDPLELHRIRPKRFRSSARTVRSFGVAYSTQLVIYTHNVSLHIGFDKQQNTV